MFDWINKLGATRQANAPIKQGKIESQMEEWFYGQNPNSAEGQQRVENQKSRDHATSERQGAETFNALEAQKNRDWQEYMSNTSYQRAMSDMQKAGINPLLAYDQGGAQSGSGATAHSSASASGASQTKDSDPLGQIVKVLGLVMSGVNTGAKIANNSANTISNIASRESMNVQRLANAEKIASLKELGLNNRWKESKANVNAAQKKDNPKWINSYVDELKNIKGL